MKNREELPSFDDGRWVFCPDIIAFGEFWIPVIKIDKDSWFGLTRSGNWVCGAERIGDQVILVEKQSPPVCLLPILELQREDFELRLKSALAEVGAGKSVEDTFPVITAIRCGMEIGSDYWASRALSWLRNYTIPGQFLKVLGGLTKAPWASQSTRQLARNLISKVKAVPAQPTVKDEKESEA
ncbi:MAG: hypothetical protein M5U26_27100 [Planctomycetota bacterium]|nr:hypothetical protein [Planctomycetota bacterium]